MERKTFLFHLCAIAGGTFIPSTKSLGEVFKTTQNNRLQNCSVRFGVPITSGSEPWRAENFLLCDVIIAVGATSYKASFEHRHKPVNPGRLVAMPIEYRWRDRRQINFDNIDSVQIALEAIKGAGRASETTRFRVEAVLEFADGRIISTGYNEPASWLHTGSRKFTRTVEKARFEHAVALREPVN